MQGITGVGSGSVERMSAPLWDVVTSRFATLRLLWRREPARSLFAQLRRSLYRTTDFEVLALDLSNLPESATPDGYEVSVVTAEELARLARMHGLEHWDFWRPQLDHVGTAGIACSGGVPVHVSWLYRPGDVNCDIPLGPSECIVSYCHTEIPHRGRGLQSCVVLWLAKAMARAGADRMYAVVAVENAASLRGLAKCGMQRVGAYRLVRILGCRWRRTIESWR